MKTYPIKICFGKAVLRVKFTTLNILEKEKRSKINYLSFDLKKSEKVM